MDEKTKLILLAEKSELENKVYSFQKRIDEINVLLQYEQAKKINWNEVIIRCLEQARTPLTTDEILNYTFYRKEHELRDYAKRRTYVLKLSLYLLRLSNKGILFGEKIKGFKGKIYGLSEWSEKTEFQCMIKNKKDMLMNEKRRFFAGT